MINEKKIRRLSLESRKSYHISPSRLKRGEMKDWEKEEESEEGERSQP
jgi:hypothetical protein